MSNKYSKPIDTELFKNKLAGLLDILNSKFQSGQIQTTEEIFIEYQQAISRFYQSPNTPFFTSRPAVMGTAPSRDDWNAMFQELAWDFDVIFKELPILETLIVKNFDFIVSERDKLNKLLKRVDSKVGDYALYANDPLKNIIYFHDSFGDTSKIDTNEKILKEKLCTIDTTQGIVTLPTKSSNVNTKRTIKVRLNAEKSNGSAGNYQEINMPFRDNLDDILDGNPDTWFEYERVQIEKDESDQPLILDLTIYFDKPEITNFIRINPNNFGSQTPILITTIETSIDGQRWLSIKDDIPITGYLQEDEENVFTLAQSTSKFAGQGLYTFTPRKAKYIHFTFQQETPYLIKTDSGDKWRYAIGIRDIEIKGVQYESKGEVVSTVFNSSKEIQKISLLASENPTETSELADILHQISLDDGSTWHNIQPMGRSVAIYPEILNINTNEPGSIPSATAVYNLRHRMVLSRNPDNFKPGATSFAEVINTGSDIATLPNTSPSQIKVSRTPIADSVVVMNPLYGARALSGTKIESLDGSDKTITLPYIHAIGRSNGQSAQTFRLPLSKEILAGLIDIGEEPTTNFANNEVVIWVDNEAWTRVASLAGASDKEYLMDNTGLITFGNGDGSTGNGYKPPAGSIIGFTLKEERLFPSATFPYKCDLVFPCDGEKENIKIYRYGNAITPSAFYLTPGKRIIRLPYKNIVNGFSFSGTGNTPNDAKTELAGLTNDRDYYLDQTEGIIYLYTAVPSGATDWKITYSYNPVYELSISDFEISDSWNFQQIAINDNAFETLDTFLDLSGVSYAGYRVANLGQKAIVPGSITFELDEPFENSGGTTSYTPIEVKFIDGIQEFQLVDTNVSTTGWFSVDYKLGILYTSSTCVISNTANNIVNFKYTNYKICYNMAKILNPNTYTVKTDEQVISLSEKEILNLWTKKELAISKENLVKILYNYVEITRDSIEDLEPFFTPIVRDITVRALPKER